jgi:hypothetical protein
VRPLGSELDLARELAKGPRLVLCGEAERRRFMATQSLGAELLARGPRGDALLRIWIR